MENPKNLPMVIEQPKKIKTYKSPFDRLYDKMELFLPDSGMDVMEEKIMRRMFVPYIPITMKGYG